MSLDLMKIFEGYVRNYHTFQLTYSHGRHSATFAEIEYFARLGSLLGYFSFTEDSTGLGNKRMDLSWWDDYCGSSKEWRHLVLHLEKENSIDRCEVTLEKLFYPRRKITPDYVIGIIAVQNEMKIKMLVDQAKEMCAHQQQVLLIFRVNNEEVHGVVIHGKKEIKRKFANVTEMGDTVFMFFADEHPTLVTKTRLFENDDLGYEEWCKLNPSGFVFNHFGGTDSQDNPNKIHNVSCTYLWRPTDIGRRTVIPKYVSTNLMDLIAKVVQKRGSSYSFCKYCEPTE